MTVKLTLRIWRQRNARDQGGLVDYRVEISPDASFLEMLDVLNERLAGAGEEPVAFDHDCREGICGMCSLVIDGTPHGPEKATTTCQLHMRKFRDGDTITVEPWRAKAFPVVKDLVVDRSAFDRIIQAGGYITAPTGTAPEAHSVPVPKPDADFAFQAAECIGCGACVAACPNGSAMLFTAAKITHLGLLPQGQPERYTARRGHARNPRRPGLRRLHQHRRMHPGLPQGNPPGRHRPPESRPPQPHPKTPLS
ncbi:Succinate dehydrogenase (quinone) [Nocardia seriolae]|uniref:Succinate dehydrogenase (Quinone) n=1 Tax=Nocardia seriolae TaxID=37332 RepID=A0ABC8B3Z7_9NOCA|nr:succinate dehydrogenase/fumarate reductase iron-sulfur subunit [Nocardia seriolae]APB00855.1 Succinate dehydrogenase (quinone) [Nocardia seriolae]